MLVIVGVLLLGLCVVTVFRSQDVLAGSLAVLGFGAITLAVLAPRMSGPVEMGPTGFKMELKEHVDKVAEIGKSAGYQDSEILEAILKTLSQEEASGSREPRIPAPGPVAPPRADDIGSEATTPTPSLPPNPPTDLARRVEDLLNSATLL